VVAQLVAAPEEACVVYASLLLWRLCDTRGNVGTDARPGASRQSGAVTPSRSLRRRGPRWSARA